MRKITPCPRFDEKAEEAVKLHTSIFRNSKVGSVTRHGEAGARLSGRRRGSVMTVEFVIEAQRFVALNGGPHFKFSPAISFMVSGRTQAEVDELWEKLSEGGEKQPCGWVKDKFGVSWQIVPSALGRMLQGRNPLKTERLMQALLKMGKPDLKALKQAYASG